MNIFEDYAYYYNLLYKDKDYEGEARYINNLIQKYKPGAKSILNLGCGTGRHDIELIKFGYDIHGVDLSEEMINQTKEKEISNRLSFEVADIRNFNSSKKFDSVVSLFHVISYQSSNDDLKNSFKTAYNNLYENGIFIFDCWYGPGVLTDPPVVRIKKMDTEKYNLIRIAEPVMHAEKNVVDVNYQVLITNKNTGVTEEIKEIHKMRYLFTPEVEYILKEVGFRLVDSFEFGNDNRPNYKSWNVCFVASKD